MLRWPAFLTASIVIHTTYHCELPSFALEFSKTQAKPTVATVASNIIESFTISFYRAIENAIANAIRNILHRPSMIKSNLNPPSSTALKSQETQKNVLKIARADKGGASVIVTQESGPIQRQDPGKLGMDYYTPLNNNPADSLTGKLDTITKNLLKESKMC